MFFASSILMVGGLAAIVLHFWEQFVGADHPQARRWYWHWLAKGVVVPALLWLLVTSGILPGLPILLPQVARTVAGGASPVRAVLNAAASGLLVIASFWAAVTLAWLATMLASRALPENRANLIASMALWGLLLLPLAWVFVHAAGWTWAGLALSLWLLPIAHAARSNVVVERPQPNYSAAIARMKFGKFSEAEWEVIQELEKCEDDYQGWMLLAELYAVHFHDLAAAEQTVREVCDQPNLHPSQIGVALHRLADWHLKPGDDPVAARRALKEICRRFAGTHLDRMARQRIHQLPATREALLAQRKGRTIRLPARRDEPEGDARPKAAPMSPEKATESADQCVELLQLDPNDVAPRERLAHLFAEQLGKIDFAIEQLELLLAMPEQSPAKSAEWLYLIATWQLRELRDAVAARQTFGRLIHRFPQAPEAFQAQKRLAIMDLEARMRTLRASSNR
jgi:tetratricopeptide (TPR) repeat protein